jgi:AcrR family transcriptional regulator
VGMMQRKERQRVDRQQRIVSTARAIAESDGWGAVTIRHLAEQIEYSQPVLYSHFENREAIVAAVAVEGFRELASVLRQAGIGSPHLRDAIHNVVVAYLAFATAHLALYEAMFAMATDLQFAGSDTKSELQEAYAALAAVVPNSRGDIDAKIETFWAVLHGLVALERSGRIRPSAREERVKLVVNGLLDDKSA